MKRLALSAAFGIFALWSSAASASDFVGPGRFCGYSPIIDMIAGERITPLGGGIHGGSFVWKGSFGELDVWATGWGRKPLGRLVKHRTEKGHFRFRQRREGGAYVVAIWNGETGVSYFRSPTLFTKAQFAAIDRVDLYNEGEDPEGCDYRTIFVLE